MVSSTARGTESRDLSGHSSQDSFPFIIPPAAALGVLLLSCSFSPCSCRESDLFLLDVQDLRAGTEGWLVFDVTAASNHWSVDQKYNLGLRLYVETDDGESSQPPCKVWGQVPRNWSPLSAVGCVGGELISVQFSISSCAELQQSGFAGSDGMDCN